MFSLNVDLSEVINEFSFSNEETKSMSKMLLDRLSDAYMYHWGRVVGKELKSTRKDYMAGMDVVRGDMQTTFILSGKNRSKLALMIEEGASPFDIKVGMEKSPKRHMSASGGWYITVPMRQATPEALGESTIFAGKMPQRVYEVAKSNAGAPVKYEQLPAENQGLGYRAEIKTEQKIIPRYEHKTPIYQGLQKRTTRKSYEQYMTFRRISDKSDQNSWMHKGFNPHKFMEKAMSELEKELPNIIGAVKQEFLDIKFADK